MMRLICLVTLATIVMGMPQSRPWEILQKAVVHVSETNDNTLHYSPNEEPFEVQWQNFKNVQKKTYPNAKEETRRRAIFKNNLKKIEMHNYLHAKGESTFTLGVNEYADLEHSEFVKVMNGLLPRNQTAEFKHGATYMTPNVPFTVPDSVDWRKQGYVTPIKNQGQCGSCWSFSTTGSLEGQHFRQTGKLVSLSEQNLVDCSKDWGNHGCNGGLMDYAFKYISDNKGDDTEKSYPYEALEGPCRFKKTNVGATDKGYTDVLPQGDEDKLKEATATVGPISIAIDASHSSFQLYREGVYVEPECSSTQLDHGVLIVGYGSCDDGDFWIVKNSWGETWGMGGYIKMARNKDNQCGVATQASYPNV